VRAGPDRAALACHAPEARAPEARAPRLAVRPSALKSAGEVRAGTGGALGTEEGAMDRAEATLGPDNTYRRDPIYSVWTWRPVTFTARGR